MMATKPVEDFIEKLPASTPVVTKPSLPVRALDPVTDDVLLFAKRAGGDRKAALQRALGDMAFLPWHRHEHNTLVRAVGLANDILCDREFIQKITGYYSGKLGINATEALFMLAARHAVILGLSDAIGLGAYHAI